jgi:hypothetical protein
MRMKKKMMAVLLTVFTIAGLGTGNVSKVLAADDDLGKIVDGSLLTEDEESTGYVDEDSIIYVGDEGDDDGISLYGTYLLDGRSAIANAGNGKITATGVTTAHKSTKLKMTVVVQRYSGTTWDYITSWTATKSSGTYLSSSKTLSVTKGYYYRVRCSHSAGGESGYSYTDGIKIK